MVQILNLGLAAMAMFSIALAAPGDVDAADRTKCTYYISTDYDVSTEYNLVFTTLTTTAYVPVETVITTSSTETKTHTYRKDESVVLASTCLPQ
ncbi:hypothetical protein V8E51_004048 [Hyaloscypha variabilis]